MDKLEYNDWEMPCTVNETSLLRRSSTRLQDLATAAEVAAPAATEDVDPSCSSADLATAKVAATAKVDRLCDLAAAGRPVVLVRRLEDVDPSWSSADLAAAAKAVEADSTHASAGASALTSEQKETEIRRQDHVFCKFPDCDFSSAGDGLFRHLKEAHNDFL
jgi:hypothetical protein